MQNQTAAWKLQGREMRDKPHQLSQLEKLVQNITCLHRPVFSIC